jgi:hypothetical protein
MGGTVFHHPESWRKLSEQIRNDLSSARGNIKLGILLNHGYLPGVVNRGPDGPPHALPSSKMAPYSGGWGPILPVDAWPSAELLKKARPAAKELLSKDIDFLVGVWAGAGAGVGATRFL